MSYFFIRCCYHCTCFSMYSLFLSQSIMYYKSRFSYCWKSNIEKENAIFNKIYFVKFNWAGASDTITEICTLYNSVFTLMRCISYAYLYMYINNNIIINLMAHITSTPYIYIRFLFFFSKVKWTFPMFHLPLFFRWKIHTRQLYNVQYTHKKSVTVENAESQWQIMETASDLFGSYLLTLLD